MLASTKPFASDGSIASSITSSKFVSGSACNQQQLQQFPGEKHASEVVICELKRLRLAQ